MKEPNLDEIHLWKIEIPKFLEKEPYYFSLLSDKEKKRANAFVFPHLKTRYSITHGILRMLLSDYLSISPEELIYNAGPYGKPFIDTHSENLFFNLSDSDELSLIGVSINHQLGVDIEKIKPDILEKNLESSVMSDAELRIFQSLSEHEKLEAFYASWTHKESIMKLLGKGLYLEPKSVEVPSRLLSEVTQVSDHYLMSFKMGEYYASVATSKPGFKLIMKDVNNDKSPL